MSSVELVPGAIGLLLGLLAGAALAWLLLRSQVQAAYERARLEGEAKLAPLAARLEMQAKQLTDCEADLNAQVASIQRLSAEAAAEAQRRAAAEEKNTRIPELQAEIAAHVADLDALENDNANIKAKLAELGARLEEERVQGEQKLALLASAEAKLAHTFKSLSADALRSNNQSFLDLAKTTLERFQEMAKGDLAQRQSAIDQLVRPVKDSLEKVDAKIQELENARQHAYGAIQQHLVSLAQTQTYLHQETANLVKALRQPAARGRWGELQLKRVVEMAGMLDHCDFIEQQTGEADDARLRPDLIVKLPGGRQIVVDAKAPISAYFDAIESNDDDKRKAKLAQHAKQMRAHVDALAKKSYWEQFQPSPEFIVMFVPGESFYSAALEQDPALLELGPEQGVLLAAPTTLLALLKAAAYGWRQENVTRNAQQISALGAELYERIKVMAEHWSALGTNLKRSVASYNDALGSLERRVLVTARKFKELGAAPGTQSIEETGPIDETPRAAQSAELTLVADQKQRP
jgi:DNA recombination protein RmuC